MTQEFLLGLLGVLPAYQDTLNQPHGSFSLSVEGDTQPSWMTPRGATLSSTKTVRSIDTVKQHYQQVSHGAAQDNLSLEKLLAFKIAVPSIQVQRHIADVLSSYDDLIENNQRRMALLEEAVQQLYREWFVRLRFPGYEHTRIIYSVPEGWKITNALKR